MTGHGINHIEKVLLIAQRLGKLSANIAARWTTVLLGPMSEMGPNSEIRAGNREVRFALKNGLRQVSLSGPKSAMAQSRCAPARSAGARAERPVADGEDSDSGLPRSTRVLSACNA